VVKRTGDAVARYGGEEFIVLLSNTDAVGGERVARNLLTALRTTSLIVGDTQLAVTCSIGIASMIPATAYQDFALISSADKALYEAKHSGRDQLALFPTDGRSLNQFL
jgi:diguanylate cyclase (GGDEF)-like protein